jgi:hypothetical protein
LQAGRAECFLVRSREDLCSEPQSRIASGHTSFSPPQYPVMPAAVLGGKALVQRPPFVTDQGYALAQRALAPEWRRPRHSAGSFRRAL